LASSSWTSCGGSRIVVPLVVLSVSVASEMGTVPVLRTTMP